MASMLMANRKARPNEGKGLPRIFAPRHLTLDIFFLIEAFQGNQPTMRNHEKPARHARELGFAGLWFRNVPLRTPNFGDVGQAFDPWAYLGWIAAQMQSIAFAIDPLILPLRHPLHTEKAAAAVGRLTGRSLVVGIKSGNRPVEAPALRIDHKQCSTLFHESFRVIALRMIGVNHVILNFKYGAGNVTDGLDQIGEETLPPLETNSQNATP
jgi:luciferase-type oxidoreductase